MAERLARSTAPLCVPRAACPPVPGRAAHRRAPRGLTLVELLLATAMTATLTVALAGLLPQTVAAADTLRRTTQPTQTARAVLALIARDLRCIEISRDAAGTSDVTLTGQSLTVTTHAPGATVNQTPQRVTYRLTASREGKRLWRGQAALTGDTQSRWFLIAEGVADLRIETFADGTWSTPIAATPPAAIRLTLRMDGQTQPTTRTVVPPTALAQLRRATR
jgi:type II secretory pathway component PulJ